MAASALEIERNPKFQELVAARKSLGWTLSIAMLVIYFGFILLVAFAKARIPGIRCGGSVTTIGIPIGLRHRLGLRPDRHLCRAANTRFDALTRQIVEESK